MLVRGCLQLFLIFGLFGAGLFSIYQLFIATDESSAPLVNKTDRQELLDFHSDNLTEFIRLKNRNYPPNAVISESIGQKIKELTAQDALAFLVQNYLNQTDVGQPIIEALKGLNLNHCSIIVSKIVDMDEERKYALLNATLFRDSRNVSDQGITDHLTEIQRYYSKGYFNKDQLALAIMDLSADQTLSLAKYLNLFSNKDEYQGSDLSPQLRAVLIRNLLQGGLTFQASIENMLLSMADDSEELLSEALYHLFISLDSESPEWHLELFNRLVSLADDDVITSFLSRTKYVEDKLGGLYQSFHSDVLQILSLNSKELMISRLDAGIVTLFESQAIDDLQKVGELATDENQLSHYSELIEKDPGNSNNYLERGKILAEEFKDHESAIKDYDQSISLDDTNSDGYFYRGLSKGEQYDIMGSIADYDKVLTLDSLNIYALGNRGIMKHQLKDYSGAIEDYTKTISIDSTYVDALYGRGLSKSYTGDTVGAIKDYSSTIQLDSYYNQAYLKRALIFIELANEEQALEDYFTVLEIEESNLDGLYGVAFIYYKMDSLELSMGYYEKLVMEYPEEAGGFYSLGIISNEREDYQQAYSFLTKTLFVDSAYNDVFLQRGWTSLQLGDTINACLDWVKAKDRGLEEATEYLATYCKN